ncbi:hypothetical protein FOZ60_005549, partial [Perkinsus olseni]
SEAILSPSIVDKQSLDSRWLSLDSEDFEAKSRVAAGGDLAKQELRRLIVAAGDPSNLNELRSSGILGTARTLMSRESSLAGTLITLLTDLPISSNVANVNTGADGRVTVEKSSLRFQQSIRQYFPGGISSASTTSPLFKELQTLIANFQGSDAAQRQASQLISATSATMAKHIAEAAVASLLSAVPSSVPPPVKYPVTFADFSMADVTSSILEGVRASFPALFASRTGKAESDTYEKCYTAYMSMQCASIFPMCTVPQASDISVVAIGKVPLCSTLCHNVLAQCPGFNLDDVSGPCDSSSVPPVCAMAHFFLEQVPPFDPTLVFAGDHSLLEAVRRAQIRARTTGKVGRKGNRKWSGVHSFQDINVKLHYPAAADYALGRNLRLDRLQNATATVDDLLSLAKAYEESRILQSYNEHALEAIRSPSIVDKQSLDSRWLSLDSEDFEAKSRVAAGGDLAKQELRMLIVAAGDPSNLNELRSSGILGTARTLMSRESSTDELKSLAGTLITLLTDLPISSNVANVNTGADGRVTVLFDDPSMTCYIAFHLLLWGLAQAVKTDALLLAKALDAR